MNEDELPVVAQAKPYYVDVEAGKNYLWCSCGLSKTQPWCDKSHVGTDYKPVVYKAQASRSMLFCGCKQTANGPFCDGSHNNLSDEYAEDERPLQELEAQTVEIEADDNGVALLDGGCYVIKPAQCNFLAIGNLNVADVIHRRLGAINIHQQLISVQPGTPLVQCCESGDIQLYGLSGDGEVVVEGLTFNLGPETGIYIRKGERYTLQSDKDLRLLLTICPGDAEVTRVGEMSNNPKIDGDQRLGRRNPALRNTMADRYYQVLLGEHNGSHDVAQFIGEVPLSKAAPHRHLYEEAIAVLSGHGVMWTETKRTDVESGDIIFLPAQQEHSLQCTDANGLALVGHFYPAGEPNINY